MTIRPEASQAAAAYLNTLSVEFAPVVVEEFRDQVIALTEAAQDRTAEVMALIENHDVANDPRTMKAWMGAMRDAAGHAPVRKSDSFDGGDVGGIPVVVFGMAAGAAQDAAQAPAEAAPPSDASLAGGNPPAPPPAAQEPEKLADPRGSYATSALRALVNFWRGK